MSASLLDSVGNGEHPMSASVNPPPLPVSEVAALLEGYSDRLMALVDKRLDERLQHSSRSAEERGAGLQEEVEEEQRQREQEKQQ